MTYTAETAYAVAFEVVMAFKVLHERGEEAVLPGESYEDTMKRLIHENRISAAFVERAQELIDQCSQW